MTFIKQIFDFSLHFELGFWLHDGSCSAQAGEAAVQPLNPKSGCRLREEYAVAGFSGFFEAEKTDGIYRPTKEMPGHGEKKVFIALPDVGGVIHWAVRSPRGRLAKWRHIV